MIPMLNDEWSRRIRNGAASDIQSLSLSPEMCYHDDSPSSSLAAAAAARKRINETCAIAVIVLIPPSLVGGRCHILRPYDFGAL